MIIITKEISPQVNPKLILSSIRSLCPKYREELTIPIKKRNTFQHTLVRINNAGEKPE